MAKLNRLMANSVAASIRLDARTLSNATLSDLEALTTEELLALRMALDEAARKVLARITVPQ